MLRSPFVIVLVLVGVLSGSTLRAQPSSVFLLDDSVGEVNVTWNKVDVVEHQILKKTSLTRNGSPAYEYTIRYNCEGSVTISVADTQQSWVVPFSDSDTFSYSAMASDSPLSPEALCARRGQHAFSKLLSGIGERNLVFETINYPSLDYVKGVTKAQKSEKGVTVNIQGTRSCYKRYIILKSNPSQSSGVGSLAEFSIGQKAAVCPAKSDS